MGVRLVGVAGLRPAVGLRPAGRDFDLKEKLALRRRQLGGEQPRAGGVDERHREDAAARFDFEEAEELEARVGRTVGRQVLRDTGESHLRSEGAVQWHRRERAGMGRPGDELPEGSKSAPFARAGS